METYTFYDADGVRVEEPISNLASFELIYCVASVDEDGEVRYGLSDGTNDADRNGPDVELLTTKVEEDLKLLKAIALGRLNRRPVWTHVLDPKNLEMGNRLPTARFALTNLKLVIRDTSYRFTQELMQTEVFTKTFVKREEKGKIAKIIVVVFTLRGLWLEYGASIWHCLYTPLLESEVDAEVVKLRKTAETRYRKFPQRVELSAHTTLGLDDYLVKVVRVHGVCSKPEESSKFVLWE
jgi:hypothetical protein